MDQRSRVERARNATTFFRWGKEGIFALVVGVVTAVASLASGQGGLLAVGIGVGATLATAFVALPLVEFGWNWLQADKHLVMDRLGAIESSLEGWGLAAGAGGDPELAEKVDLILERLDGMWASDEQEQRPAALPPRLRLGAELQRGEAIPKRGKDGGWYQEDFDNALTWADDVLPLIHECAGLAAATRFQDVGLGDDHAAHKHRERLRVLAQILGELDRS